MKNKKDLSLREKIEFIILTYGVVLVFAMNVGIDAKTAGFYGLLASLFITCCLIFSQFSK